MHKERKRDTDYREGETGSLLKIHLQKNTKGINLDEQNVVSLSRKARRERERQRQKDREIKRETGSLLNINLQKDTEGINLEEQNVVYYRSKA